MKVENTLTIAPDVFIANIFSYFSSLGIHLEVGDNFWDYSAALRYQKKRHSISPTFSSRNSSLNENNSFWIIGRNDSNEIVHTQAAHCINLEDRSLATYLNTNIREFSSFTDDNNNLRYNSGPNSNSIKGNACYHGEFWLNIGPSRCGTAGMATLLSKLAMAMSLQRWNIDCFFAFMMALKACRGLAARGGYLHAEPYSVVWDVPNAVEEQEAWLVWANKKDIEYLIEITPALLAKIPNRNDDQKKQVTATA